MLARANGAGPRMASATSANKRALPEVTSIIRFSPYPINAHDRRADCSRAQSRRGTSSRLTRRCDNGAGSCGKGSLETIPRRASRRPLEVAQICSRRYRERDWSFGFRRLEVGELAGFVIRRAQCRRRELATAHTPKARHQRMVETAEALLDLVRTGSQRTWGVLCRHRRCGRDNRPCPFQCRHGSSSRQKLRPQLKL